MIIAQKSSRRSGLRKLTKCLLFLYEADIGEEENLCGVTCLVKIGNLKFES